MTLLHEIPGKKQMDALVGESRRGEDRRERREAPGAETRLLQQLAPGARLRRLTGMVENTRR